MEPEEMTLTQKAEAERMQKAAAMFAGHEIVSSSVDGIYGRWDLRAPGTSNDAAEIVELAGGHIVVHGDIDALLIGPHRCHQKAGDAIMRAARDVDEDGAAHNRVLSGMSVSRNFVFDLVESVAHAELVAWIRAHGHEEPEDGFDEFVNGIEDELGDDDRHDLVYEVLGRLDVAYESMPHDEMAKWGLVTSWRVAKGLAAVKRLAHLLSEPDRG